MIVVGGKNSSNTKELAVKCREICADTIHVADADELAAEHADWLPRKPRIGITGGTSTPEVDLEEVRERIYALAACAWSGRPATAGSLKSAAARQRAAQTS